MGRFGRFYFITSKIDNLKFWWARTSPQRYICFLRKQGCSIGKNLKFRGGLKNISIDLTRPSLITIGDNVLLNANSQLITHDYVSGCFLNKYGAFINSSGAITIGNNVRFGRNVTVLKGVTIGDNVFVGINSVVTRDIPSNSIAVGSPARVICTMDDYYEKRKQKCIPEVFEYARSIQERFHRMPEIEDFWEEFPLFVDKDNMHLYPNLPYKRQLGDSLPYWLERHKRVFEGFEEFLEAAGVK